MMSTSLTDVQSGNEKEISIIKSYRTASNDAIIKKDINGISKYWMDDFIQIRGNASYLAGKEKVTEVWKTLFENNPEVSYARNAEQVIISDNGSLAWEKGTWTSTNSYSKGGNYSAMWRKINNHWMLQAELFVALFDA